MATTKLVEKFNKEIEEIQTLAEEKDKSLKVYLHQLINIYATDEILERMIEDMQKTKNTWRKE